MTTCHLPGTGPSGLDSLQPHPQTHAMSIDPPLWSKYAHCCITQRTFWAPTLCAAQPKADTLSCFQPHLHQPLMPHGVGAVEGALGEYGRPCLRISPASQCWEMRTRTRAHTHSHKPSSSTSRKFSQHPHPRAALSLLARSHLLPRRPPTAKPSCDSCKMACRAHPH